MSRDAIEQIGRHVLVRPAGMDDARAEYSLDPRVAGVQRVFYRTPEGLVRQDPDERLSLTRRLAVHPGPGVNLATLLQPYSVVSSAPATYAPHIWLVELGEDAALETALDLWQGGQVIFAVPQFERVFVTRHIPNDPLFSFQWSLLNTGQSGGNPGDDIRATQAWDQTFGATTLIGIVDNGLDFTHPDLASSYRPFQSWDFNDRDEDPSPLCSESHGTHMAGITAAAADNDVGISGVAPRAWLAGLRLLSGPFSDEDAANALSHFPDAIFVYNNSWGPADNGQQIEGPGPLLRAAMQAGVQNGRTGLGSVYVWAAGNGGMYDDANFDGFANSRFVIAVTASTDLGTAAAYAEPGACILVNAPSAGGSGGILTTDNVGLCGVDPSDYYFNAGGTSASAATVSGVVALLLEHNPLLTWRDVQHILIDTAVQNDPLDPAWFTNRSGRPHHHRYGFGRVDASAAVEAAATWTPVRPELEFERSAMGEWIIPDGQETGVNVTLAISERIQVERVQARVIVAHPRRGDLEFRLTAPSGTESVLGTARSGDAAADLDWVFSTVRNWGEESRGNWRLNVRDVVFGEEGAVLGVSVSVFGSHIELPLGDMNTDGQTDFRDTPDFILALRDRPAYLLKYPGIDPEVIGDVNTDGSFNTFDIQPFVGTINP